MVEVAGDIDNDAAADDLAGYAGASCARDEVRMAAAGFLQQLANVVFVFGIGYAKGCLAIGGGVGSVCDAVEAVGVNHCL